MLGVLRVGFWLHSNGGTSNMIWKIKCIYKFPCNIPQLETQVFCEFVNSLHKNKVHYPLEQGQLL